MDWLEQERALLHRCMKDKLIMGKAAAQLTGYPFVEKTTTWVWEQFLDMYKAGSEAPSYRLLVSRIENLPEKEQDEKTEELIAIMRTTPEASPRAVISAMQVRSRKLGTVEAMERANEAFEKGDDKAGLEAMERAMRSKVVRPGIIVKPMFPKKYVPLKPQARVPTGLYRLDRIIGGAQRGEVNYIIAAMGVGKSALCTTFAHSALKTGHRVLYLDTENGEHVVTSRFYSRCTSIPYELIEQNLLGPESRELLDIWLARNSARFEDRFRFAQLGFGAVTMAQVEATIVEQIESGFRPDLVVFDSPDHAMMEGEAQRWEKFAEVANQLKGVTERTDVAMWATSQAGGENIETRIATASSAADSKQKARNAAVLVSINRRIDPKTHRPVADDNARDLYIAKARNAQAGFILPLQCDLGRMRISAPPDFDAHGGYAEHADK